MNKLKKMDFHVEKYLKPLIFYLSILSNIFCLIMYGEWQIFIFKTLKDVYNHDTRPANNFHLPITNLTKYPKGAYYAGIKIFNHFPTHSIQSSWF
jgi:hypothetical protein